MVTRHPTSAVDALDTVTAALTSAEHRDGQREMAAMVEAAFADEHHLVVQAGTGTGKTLAYLVPAALSGRRTMVVTATKALQDQLATKDLPFLADQMAELGVDLEWAVLKGRSNYICLQRLRELDDAKASQLDLDNLSVVSQAEVVKLRQWAGATKTGDLAELDWSPSDAAWRSVSTGSDECPGADRCPVGDACFAEQARDRAHAADLVVVNTHLYGLHIGSGGAILPPHEAVVFDEAHVIEDIFSDTVGTSIAPGRFISVAATVRRFLDDPEIVASLANLASVFRDALGPSAGVRFGEHLPPEIGEALTTARERLTHIGEVLTEINPATDDAKQRKLRAQRSINVSTDAIDAAINRGEGTVAFVSGRSDQPVLEIAPLDVGPILAASLWNEMPAVLTSATIPANLARRVGLADDVTVADVASPFDYGTQSMLYCAMHLPPPKSPKFRDLAADELAALITAAGGRTLALFTSWAAMDHAVDALRDRLTVPILTQRDLPKPALVKAFSESEATCLFATTGLFQGIDVPGRTLSLVVIDKLPFPRPDDPLLSARRERLGASAFGEIDVPRAATLLAQASGRLIRNHDDRGVVAVLDSRLGSARYRWDIIKALPPMRRTRDRAEAEAFLRELAADQP